MKIQIIAFPRSGTTLTYRLFKNHPDIEAMFFEKLLLKSDRFKNKKYFFKKYPVFLPGHNCGEKNIYAKPIWGKLPIKPHHITPIDYCNKWNKLFKDEARIIQIVRHPLDAWNSMIRKNYIKRGWEARTVRALQLYCDYFPKYVSKIMKFDNCLTIKYEDLVLYPDKIIKDIYNFCDLRMIKYEKMKTNKVFWYKKTGVVVDTHPKVRQYRDKFFEVMNENWSDLVKVLNKIPGPEYKEF